LNAVFIVKSGQHPVIGNFRKIMKRINLPAVRMP